MHGQGGLQDATRWWRMQAAHPREMLISSRMMAMTPMKQPKHMMTTWLMRMIEAPAGTDRRPSHKACHPST